MERYLKNRVVISCVLLFLLFMTVNFVSENTAGAATCVRYSSIVPTVQKSSDNASIKWTTPGFTSSSVVAVWKTSVGASSAKFVTGGLGTNHTVNLTGLTQNTNYTFYAESFMSGICKRTLNYSFTTETTPPPSPPPPDPPTPPPYDPPDPWDEPDPPGDNGPPDEPVPYDEPTPEEDKEVPTAPENLKATFNDSGNTIDLIWDASSDAVGVAGYEIERTEKGKEAWAKIKEVDTEQFSDFGFEPNKIFSYRVRAFDSVKNFSDYSNITEVVSGDFEPNVSPKNGGKIEQEGVLVDFPAGSVEEDLLIRIEKSNDNKDIVLEKNEKFVGSIYEIQAKNSRGEEVKKFKTQITIKFKFTKKNISSINSKTIKMATFSDGNGEYLKTSLDLNAYEATTLTDHLSRFFLVAQKGNPLNTLTIILTWLFVLAIIGAAGYFGYKYYLKRKYREEHSEDYIYKY